MARLLRADHPSLWYHLTARGNEQRLIFRDDRDREHFLELLAQWVDRFRRRLETDRRLRALAEEAESYLSNVQS